MKEIQVPLSMGFSRQEYWSGLPFPSPGDFPAPGIEPGSLALQADSLPSEPPGQSLTVYRQAPFNLFWTIAGARRRTAVALLQGYKFAPVF